MSVPARRLSVATLVAVAVVAATAPADLFSRQDVTIPSADGTRIAATPTLPDGVAPPGGWSAVIYRALTGARDIQLGVAGPSAAR